MNVAQLTYDHLDKRKGDLGFSFEGLCRYWAGQNFGDDSGIPSEDTLDVLPVTRFKLYDDDGILYFSGWLKDDEDSMVQMFVGAWAAADSGCTTLKVERNGEWVQDIG